MSGDHEFEEFFRQDFHRLVGFVMKLGAQQCQAEDIAAEAHAAAFQSWGTVRHPEAYVRRVATRIYFKDLALIRREDPLEEVLTPDTFDVAEHIAQCDLVLAAIRNLSPKQRVVMSWKIDGYPPVLIANELGISPDDVRKTLQRARETLKVLLAAIDEG
ncbi:RNA polymerase sigma factor [Actinomadura napierensis]|uniref:RNA polymerase sigma factor 70 region 4 type 2 domain-containing protein n=1 Tax=Actinomadura napierensis TaxID=267854 RepID=A0ABP5M6K3_9ACTN